jgi:hypothetical protein|tara:strand:- start:281 stop:610 length:330 start_codon:yes stop_codon:yes gene_type:complete
MKSRFIIVDPNEGIFLGTRSDVDREGIGMLFSAHNFLELTQAVSWKTRRLAFAYMSRYIRPTLKDCFVAEIETNSKGEFVSVYDICRSGYGDLATEMVDVIYMQNELVH